MRSCRKFASCTSSKSKNWKDKIKRLVAAMRICWTNQTARIAESLCQIWWICSAKNKARLSQKRKWPSAIKTTRLETTFSANKPKYSTTNPLQNCSKRKTKQKKIYAACMSSESKRTMKAIRWAWRIHSIGTGTDQTWQVGRILKVGTVFGRAWRRAHR